MHGIDKFFACTETVTAVFPPEASIEKIWKVYSGTSDEELRIHFSHRQLVNEPFDLCKCILLSSFRPFLALQKVCKGSWRQQLYKLQPKSHCDSEYASGWVDRYEQHEPRCGIFTGIYSHFMDLILKTSRYGSIVPFFWGVSKARIRTCFPQMQSAEGTACFWQWRSKPGDQCFRSQVVDVQSDSAQAGEERCPEAEMPYIILHLALKKTYKTVTKCLPSDFSLQRLAVQLELFSSKLPPPMKECKQIQILCCKENSGALRPQTGETNIECCKRHVAIMLQMIKGHPH